MTSRLIGAVCLLFAASISVAEQEVVEKFGAWSKICADLEDGGQRCQIVQSASQNETKQLIFQTAVGYLPESERPIMFLTAPLGIFLPKGISVVVGDDTQGLTAAVQRCDGKGCLAVMPLEKEMVTKLEKGKSAKIFFAATNEQNVSLPMDLTGFRKAFRSLN